MNFVRRCISVRNEFSILQQCFLLDDNYQHSDYHHHVSWIRPDGEEKQIEDWHNHDNQCLGLIIADDDKGYQLLLLLNSSTQPVTYVLPEGRNKTCILDTSFPEVENRTIEEDTESYQQLDRSLSLWKIDYQLDTSI